MTQLYVCYYRVSTARQGQSGLGLDAQRAMVAQYLAARGGDIAAEFTDVVSGKRQRKKGLAIINEAIDTCRKRKAVLLIAKLDRLARNVAFVTNLRDKGVEFVAADMPDANRLTVTIIAAIAEHEAEMISQRTKAALQAARERGTRLGSPDTREASRLGARMVQIDAARHAATVYPVILSIRKAGVTSLVGMAEALNARGIPTPRGGAWHASSVRNILARVDLTGRELRATA